MSTTTQDHRSATGLEVQELVFPPGAGEIAASRRATGEEPAAGRSSDPPSLRRSWSMRPSIGGWPPPGAASFWDGV